MLILQIAVWCCLGLFGGYIASNKGYSPKLGILIGILLGPLGIVIALLMPRTSLGKQLARMERETREELAESSKTRPCPKCRRINSQTTKVCPRCDHRFT